MFDPELLSFHRLPGTKQISLLLLYSREKALENIQNSNREKAHYRNINIHMMEELKTMDINQQKRHC